MVSIGSRASGRLFIPLANHVDVANTRWALFCMNIKGLDVATDPLTFKRCVEQACRLLRTSFSDLAEGTGLRDFLIDAFGQPARSCRDWVRTWYE
jgi:hypothetical protein